MVEHDLGVGTDVHQHLGLPGPAQADGLEAGHRVSTHMAGDERQAVDTGATVGAQAQIAAKGQQGGVRAPTVPVLVLDERLVWLLADALDIDAEQDVPHGGVGGHHDLVDVRRALTEVGDHLPDALTDGCYGGVLKLAGHAPPRLVGDTVHDIAAAELLGVLEAGDGDGLARLQVDQLQHHGGGSQVDRHAEDGPAVGVDHLARIGDPVANPAHHRVEPFPGVTAAEAGLQDPRPAAERLEADRALVAHDLGLTCQPEAAPQKALRLGARRQRFHAAGYLHHALVALPVS